MIASLAGRLLVATPLLEDRNFARTVVLICVHNEQGALGLVLNRPLDEAVALHLPEWSARAAAPPVFFAGGPVLRTVVMALGVNGAAAGTAFQAEWWTRVTPELGLIDLRDAPDDVERVVEPARLFVGHAGWGAGQLEMEIVEEAWFVVDSRPGDALTPHPERLRAEVLRRQRGRRAERAWAGMAMAGMAMAGMAMYANYPADPRLNERITAPSPASMAARRAASAPVPR